MKYRIKGVNFHYVSNNGELSRIFDGFKLEKQLGSVDPFVSGSWDGDLEIAEETDQEKIIEWANQQVGKWLVCDELMCAPFATYGATYVSEEV